MKQPRQIQPVGLSIDETIKATGLGRTSVYKEIAEGRLRSYKVGRRRFVAPDELVRWRQAAEASAA
ncbi:helix-turn-helix domain-containing protein [Thiorhodococcus minor]|uniref:Helix-turn-helix domain-containing protein n=1 Tax=Thiorhodococcus minor TaxID=57489 RepID=A0A6M0JXN3_9GAMM|nr:helix-turn-helix domain-containing protein [Thiorhodococcus minor]NEV62270.1 helix-turn-helix domain-containing protein [Thiorhodococcus minor]